MDEVAPGLRLVAVRTPTLPPATHTNTWIAGSGRLTVFDPASPYEDEQERLFELLEERRACGERVERIVLTHHHHDHVGGAEALREQLDGVPIAAHPITRDLVSDRIAVDILLEDGDTLSCGGRILDVLHTPGHAPGHLVFLDRADRWCIAGDMVAGVGTILIDPKEGSLALYLASLDRMRAHRPAQLMPAHGPVIDHADEVLAFYIAHRHQRTEQIRQALGEHGAQSPLELAAHVYAEIPAAMYPIAAVQIEAHLRWLADHGRVRAAPGGKWEPMA